MDQNLISDMKAAIRNALKSHLHSEGLALYIAANDNTCNERDAAIVTLESLEDSALRGSELLSEIRVTLRLQGKPWRCDTLVCGIYQALQPHYVSQRALGTLLMGLHVDIIDIKPQRVRKRATLCYIVEENADGENAGAVEATMQLQFDMAGG